MNQLISEFLHRNGVICERAKREGRSLSYMERQIVVAGRLAARAKGLDQKYINEQEMAGERDWDNVLTPIKVVAKFAYWQESSAPDFPSYPEYLILVSNHPELPVFGNVSAETLNRCGIKTPSTPSLEQWIRTGKKVYRGEQR